MYKLLCSNITKTHKSLTNFTGYYRKVAQKCNRSASTTKNFVPETDIQNKQAVDDGTEPVECSEEALEAETPAEKKTKSYGSFFTQNIGLAPLGRPEANGEQLIPATTSQSRLFHSSTSDNQCSTAAFKKHFKNVEAEKYYQLAVDQFHQQSSWSARSSKAIFNVQTGFEHIESRNNKKNARPKTLKHVQKERLDTIPELEKIAEMKNAKPKSQFKQSKIRITYPTHIARYKMGSNSFKLQHTVKQQVVQHDQIKTVYKDPVPEPLQSTKIKHEMSSERDKAMVQEMRNKAYQRRLEKKCHHDNIEYTRQQNHNKSIIQQHPTVKRTNTSVRMAFKNRYNKLLQKSGLLYQAPVKTKEQQNPPAKDQAETPGSKQPTTSKSTYGDTHEILFRKTEKWEPQVTEHPIATAKQPKVDSTLKYPKRILSEKSENFDIDATCIKDSNSANVTMTYGDYIAESDDKVRSFVETHKQEAKELLDKTDKKNPTKGGIKTSEIPKSTVIKEITSCDGIGDYLRKLKELRDQTAIDTLKIKKTEVPKQQVEQKTEGKKIKMVVKKFEEQIDKTSKKAKPQKATEEKAGLKSDIFVDKDTGKIKQYPISDKFVAKKDDSLIQKAVNAVKDTVTRKTRPTNAKVRSQSVEHPRQETSSLTRSIPLKKVKSENLAQKVPSQPRMPKINKPLHVLQPATIKPVRSENLPKKIKLKPLASGSNTSKEKYYKFPKPKAAKQVASVEPNTLKKIMDQYKVPIKVEFTVSMAEIKRVNRKKRREREKQLKEEVKMQQRKLEEEAMKAVRDRQRKHKYKLDAAGITDKISQSKQQEDLVNADNETKQDKEEIAFKKLEKEARKTSNVQENSELVADEAHKESKECDLNLETSDSKVLKEKEVQENFTCSTAEIKVVNRETAEQNVEKNAATDLELKETGVPERNLKTCTNQTSNEHLENMTEKSVDLERKPSVEEMLSKSKEIPEKYDNAALEEREYRLRKQSENQIMEKENSKLKQQHSNDVPKAKHITPKENLENASVKKQLLQENNQTEDAENTDLQYTKNPNKLKIRKTKVKAQILGKRKSLQNVKETPEKLSTTTLKSKKQKLDTNTVLTQNMSNKNVEKTTKKTTDQQRQPTTGNNSENSKITWRQMKHVPLTKEKMQISKKDVEKTSQEVRDRPVLDTNLKPVNSVLKEAVQENLEKTPEKLSVENNLQNSNSGSGKTAEKRKDIEYSGDKEMKDKETLKLMEISLENHTVGDVKKLDSHIQEIEETKKVQNQSDLKYFNVSSEKTESTINRIEAQMSEAATKSNSEAEERKEKCKLEEILENETNTVEEVKRTYLLEDYLKKRDSNTLKQEEDTENIRKLPAEHGRNISKIVSGSIDSKASKETEVKVAKEEKEEKIKESLEEVTNTVPDVKGKYMLENNLKRFTNILEEQTTRENSREALSNNNLEKSSSKLLEVKKRETPEEYGKINFNNVLEEITKHVPDVNIKKSTSNLLEGKFNENLKKMPTEKNIPKLNVFLQQKECTVKEEIKKASQKLKNEGEKLERNLEKRSLKETGRGHPNQQLENVSLQKKPLGKGNAHETKTEKQAVLEKIQNCKDKSLDVKSSKKENHVVDKLNKFQQDNLTKLKEASTKIVKLVKKIDLMKYTYNTEEKSGKSTVPDNQPTIRREQPPKSKDKPKKKQPKSKTDIVLPPKGRNDPKMRHVSKNTTLEEPRRDIIEEINEALRKASHASLSKEEIKKCKSLADLAEEQKTKILKEIETTWNKENDKIKEDQEAKDINEVINASDYYDNMKDVQEKRKLNIDNATFCLNSMKNKEGVKQNRILQKEKPRLIVKLRYKGHYDKPNIKDNRLKVSNTTDEVNDKSNTFKTENDMPRSVSFNITHQEGNSNEGTSIKSPVSDIIVFKGKPGESKAASPFHFRRMKRARIEDDFLRIDRGVLNIELSPTDIPWRSQNDLDFNFTKLKKAKIEDECVMYEIKDIKETLQQDQNENDVGNSEISTAEKRWHGKQDKVFCFQKLKRGKIEDDKQIKEIVYKTILPNSNSGKNDGNSDSLKNISSLSTILDQPSNVGQVATKVKAMFGETEKSEEKKLDKSDAGTELDIDTDTAGKTSKTVLTTRKLDQSTASNKKNKVHSKVSLQDDTKIKSEIQKLIHVMKNADKQLEEVLKVYEILKLSKPQNPTLVKPDDYNSTKQNKTEIMEQSLKLKKYTEPIDHKDAKQDNVKTTENCKKPQEKTEPVVAKKVENFNSRKQSNAGTAKTFLKENTKPVNKMTENCSSAKQDNTETKGKYIKPKENTDPVAVKKAKAYPKTKDSKTYIVAGREKRLSKTRKFRETKTEVSNTVPRKPSTPEGKKRDSIKECKLEEKSVKSNAKPNTCLLTASVQKQTKRPLKERKDEVKSNDAKTTMTGYTKMQPKKAKICHKDKKETDKTLITNKNGFKAKETPKHCRKGPAKKNLLCPEPKSAKLDCSKHEDEEIHGKLAENKTIESTVIKTETLLNTGGKTIKDYSDSKLSVQLLSNDGKETLGNKIVVTCNNYAPGESPIQSDKSEEKKETQEKQVEIPGKKKTNMHVSMSSDIPHDTPTSHKNRKTLGFGDLMVKNPGTPPKKRTKKRDNNTIQRKVNEMKVQFPILRSDMVDMFIKSKKGVYDRKIKIIRTFFINRTMPKDTESVSLLPKESNLVISSTKNSNIDDHTFKLNKLREKHLLKKDQKQKTNTSKHKMGTIKLKKCKNIKKKTPLQISSDSKSTNCPGELSRSKLKIVKLAENARENIFHTKHMLDKQIEVIKAAVLPRLGNTDDKSKSDKEKMNVTTETVNMNQSGKLCDSGNEILSKGEKIVTLLEKNLMEEATKLLTQKKSVQNLEKGKLIEVFTNKRKMKEESSNSMPKQNFKSDSGDCKAGYREQNQIIRAKLQENLPMKLEGEEQKQIQQYKERTLNNTEKTIFKFSNNYLDNAYKKVRHILSIVNDENIYLAEKNAKANEGANRIEDKTGDEKMQVKIEQNDKIKLEKNKDCKPPATELGEKPNIKIDMTKLESEIQNCNLNWSMKINSKQNTDQKIDVMVSENISKKTVDIQERKEEKQEHVQAKTESTKNQNTIEGNEKLSNKIKENAESKMSLKAEDCKIRTEQRLILKALEIKNKTGKPIDTNRKFNKTPSEIKLSLNRPVDTTQSSMELRSLKCLSNKEEDLSKGNKFTSTTEPCLQQFNTLTKNTKLDEKNKYKYTSQKIRQSLMKHENITIIETGKKNWQTQDKNRSKISLHLNKTEKTGTETTDNQYKTQQRNECKYTNQKVKQSSTTKKENDVKMNATNKNNKRAWDVQNESLSKTSEHIKKKQKTGSGTNEVTFRNKNYSQLEAKKFKKCGKENSHKTVSKVRITQEKNKMEEPKDKNNANRDRKMNPSLLCGIKSGYVAPRNSDSDLRLAFEKLRMEEKLRRVFAQYLSHMHYFKTKFSKNESNDSIIFSKNKNPVTTPKKRNAFRKQSILSQIKKHALPTVPEIPMECTSMNCQNDEEEEEETYNFEDESGMEESKVLIPEYFLNSNKDIQNSVVTSLRFSEKLIQKLKSRMNYDKAYAERNTPAKAQIEQIFKKHYNDHEKIYKFNKNLIRHLQQHCEKNPQLLKNHQLILSSKVLLDPRSVKMQKMLYKFIVTEMKKPICKNPTGFPLFKKHNEWDGIVYYSKDKEDRLPTNLPETKQKLLSKKTVTFYIEKAPKNRYKKENDKKPVKPVTRSCERLCLPLKAISQVALKPSVEEMTTLNKYHIGKVHIAPKTVFSLLDKYKGLKITYINIKRPIAKPDEGFLPTILTMKNKSEAKALEKVNESESLKRQILEFRYEILRKLHKEFSALYEKDVNNNIGKFEKVSKYYKLVTANLKNKEKQELEKLKSKSMEELLGPSSKPSFERVSRYYNMLMNKDKEADRKETSEEVWNNTKTLVQKLSEKTTEIDKSRNNCKGMEQILTKSKKKDNRNKKDPEDPQKQS